MKKNKEKGQELGAVIENKKENYPPTGEWSQVKPEINEKCIACGQCVKACPEDTIRIKKRGEKDRATVDYDYCKGCGLCAGVCPVQAIEMVEKNKD
ncbi:MAG: 4Fe-4S binding protein [Candidatus Moranbacteria bacterium]|nr:4Fe-4S binding protein [Candidatus Moranbacteria bacterium]